MPSRVNTIARLLIALYFTIWGLAAIATSPESITEPRILSQEQYVWTMKALGAVTMTAGLFLFIRATVKKVSLVLILATILLVLTSESGALANLKSLALIGSLLLLMKNDSGETFIEFIQTDIEHLPDYKTRL